MIREEKTQIYNSQSTWLFSVQISMTMIGNNIRLVRKQKGLTLQQF